MKESDIPFKANGELDIEEIRRQGEEERRKKSNIPTLPNGEIDYEEWERRSNEDQRKLDLTLSNHMRYIQLLQEGKTREELHEIYFKAFGFYPSGNFIQYYPEPIE